jgi:hypothetical protein
MKRERNEFKPLPMLLVNGALVGADACLDLVSYH